MCQLRILGVVHTLFTILNTSVLHMLHPELQEVEHLSDGFLLSFRNAGRWHKHGFYNGANPRKCIGSRRWRRIGPNFKMCIFKWFIAAPKAQPHMSSTNGNFQATSISDRYLLYNNECILGKGESFITFLQKKQKKFETFSQYVFYDEMIFVILK